MVARFLHVPSRRRGVWLFLVTLVLTFTLATTAWASDPFAHAVGDSTIDRTTPRRALVSFLDATRAGDFTAAAHCFDMRGSADAKDGPELAEELSYVLYRRAAIDLDKVPDDPAAHDGQVTVDTFTVGEQEVPLLLVRVKFEDGISRWVFSRTTVRRIPDIAATVRGALWEQRLPRVLRRPVIFGNAPWQWIGILLFSLLAFALGKATAFVVGRLAAPVARHLPAGVDGPVIAAAERPIAMAMTATLVAASGHLLQASQGVTRVLDHLGYTGLVVGLSWLLLVVVDGVALAISEPADAGNGVASDQAGARTRRALLERVASAAIVAITLSILLLQFDIVRHVGVSLLASAGIAGVVLGFAAQKSLAGIIAGIQLSITQPIRLGDTIFIEGEEGLVQDIFLTYAVIRFWDDRSLVVPLARFLDQPFQNRTLLTRDLGAVVLLHVKFTAPIGPMREKARAICDAHPKWDKRRCELQIGDSDMYGMVVRVRISARTPADSWDLRCAVREGLIEFLRTLDGGVHLG
jgi:small-conductance mechanosensitive channel